MKPQQWIKLSGLKKGELARLMGVSNQRITRIFKHGLTPHPGEMAKLYWISSGAVRPDDWYDLTLPADLQPLLDASAKSRLPTTKR